jgi:predicted GNAT family acetyltransferase
MAFCIGENHISYKENDEVLAEVAFPPAGIGIVDICHTRVDSALRGKGMAGQLLEHAVADLRRTKRKAVVTCSYAEKWFAEHPECADVLAEEK